MAAPVQGWLRLIPACAGNRQLGSHGQDRKPAHPRLCGEQLRTVATRRRDDGSSPEVLGTVPQKRQACLGLRFIPACAGNSGLDGLIHGDGSVHPRLCGEQLGTAHNNPIWCGSSPPLRGTVGRQRIGRAAVRFIPACARNSRDSPIQICRLPVHPRLYGEQCSFLAAATGCFGSSPHVRGTAWMQLHDHKRCRLIPGCAGNRLAVGS